MAAKMKANRKQSTKKQKPMTQLQALGVALKALRKVGKFTDEPGVAQAIQQIKKLQATLQNKQERQARIDRTRPKRAEEQVTGATVPEERELDLPSEEDYGIDDQGDPEEDETDVA